ncbi:hypothetical protein PINS_up016912 [Pythium insidiosum]|nr:hypothetical protein PINS_up015860 [Pythium insidiosum]GLE07043.1 hypothetical protein PINS_up016912 [Pythium insidiosum]
MKLKQTTSDLEIANEVQKANLEAIMRLETTAAPPSQHPEDTNAVCEAEPINDDEGSRSEEEGDEEDESIIDENERLRALCVTFQEQCLWRSIETSESEKRNLALEAEMNRVQAAHDALKTQFDELTSMSAKLVEQNRTLKAQKSLLVKEVKRLQPYSETNLAVLIHDAQEARMVQRSLQAQLEALSQSCDAGQETADDGSRN